MNAVPYDFTRPSLLAAEWQQKLHGWFQRACTVANKAWARQLPFPVEASVAELELRYGKACLPQLAEGVVGYRVLLAERRVPTFLSLQRSTLLNLVGAMLGDDAVADPAREMTPIEENLADYFLVHYWLPYFRETWPGGEMVSWELQPREANPQCSRIFTDADVVLALRWQLSGPWGESSGTWFFHKNSLLEALGDRTRAEVVPEPVLAARRETLVATLPVTVEVVVGTAELKLTQLSQLQAGDVLLLDQREAAPLIARVGGRELFRGKPGRLGGSKALQIETLTPSAP